jgi:CRP/FNR family transcriptional regulator, cyclic AMP receptor protein
MTMGLPDAVARELTGGRGRRPARQPEQGPRLTKRRSAVALAGIPLFEGFSRRHLSHLATEADEVSFAPGEHIVQEGLLGETLFVVLEGQAKVVREGRTVGRVIPGDFVGELSAIDGGPRTASVIAETPVVAVRLFRRTLVALLKQEPLLCVKLLQGIARRLRDLERPISA